MSWTEIMKGIAIIVFSGVVILVILPTALYMFLVYGDCIREWLMKKKGYTTSQEKNGTISRRKRKKS